MGAAPSRAVEDVFNFRDDHLSDLYCDRVHSGDCSAIPATTVRFVARGLARAVIAACLHTTILSSVLMTGPAEAADSRPERRAPKAAGPRVAGPMVAGPIVGGIAANNGYYAYGPYARTGTLPWSPLYGPALPVRPGCWLQRQRLWTEYGWRWRVAPICY